MTSPTSPTPSQAPRKPPRALFKYVMNPLLRFVLRSPWHHKISQTLLLLTFAGRKSGKFFSTPVAYHPQGTHYLLFTHSPWWKNLDGGAPVTLRLRGQEVQGWAEAIHDPDLILASLEPLLRHYGVRQAQRLGLRLEAGHEPTQAELRTAIDQQGLVMIRIQVQA